MDHRRHDAQRGEFLRLAFLLRLGPQGFYAGPLSAAVAPGSSGLGQIQSGYVEISNVDLSQEMANLITAQRGFEANSKVVSTSDELLQTLVNMKQG